MHFLYFACASVDRESACCANVLQMPVTLRSRLKIQISQHFELLRGAVAVALPEQKKELLLNNLQISPRTLANHFGRLPIMMQGAIYQPQSASDYHQSRLAKET